MVFKKSENGRGRKGVGVVQVWMDSRPPRSWIVISCPNVSICRALSNPVDGCSLSLPLRRKALSPGVAVPIWILYERPKNFAACL